ncbi:hypothetical protein LCGC14_2141450, partial [marine sediment metagenome]
MILVTGAAGLIGAHLCKRLVSEGCEVVGWIHNRSDPLIESLVGCNNFRIVVGDIRNLRDTLSIIREYKIKTVFHTAAQLPYTIGKDLIGVNVGGTFKLLEVAHTYEIEDIVYASSMGVYSDPPDYLPVDEIHPTRPSTEYGDTKLAGELICGRYVKSMRVTILRYAGIYG